MICKGALYIVALSLYCKSSLLRVAVVLLKMFLAPRPCYFAFPSYELMKLQKSHLIYSMTLVRRRRRPLISTTMARTTAYRDLPAMLSYYTRSLDSTGFKWMYNRPSLFLLALRLPLHGSTADYSIVGHRLHLTL